MNARSLTLAVLDPFKRVGVGGAISGGGEDSKAGQSYVSCSPLTVTVAGMLDFACRKE